MKTPLAFAVALEIKSRYRRPNIGKFVHDDRVSRQIWRKETTSDISRLAELTNEALDFLRVLNDSTIVLVVLDVTNHLRSEGERVEKPAPPAEEEGLTRRRGDAEEEEELTEEETETAELEKILDEAPKRRKKLLRHSQSE